MSDTVQRPGSADTMLLVWKPREEDYKQVSAQIAGTKNEQQAYRKNRVIQMKLGTYLNEVSLQEKHSACIFMREKRRLLQQFSKRSIVPPSVRMMEQLKQFKGNKFFNPVNELKGIPNVLDDSLDVIPEPSKDQQTLQCDSKSLVSFPKHNHFPPAFAHDQEVASDDTLSSKKTFFQMSTLESELRFPIIKGNYRDDTKQWKDLNPVKHSLVFPSITAKEIKRTQQKPLGNLLNKATNDLSQVEMKTSSSQTISNSFPERKTKRILNILSVDNFTSEIRLNKATKLRIKKNLNV